MGEECTVKLPEAILLCEKVTPYNHPKHNVIVLYQGLIEDGKTVLIVEDNPLYKEATIVDTGTIIISI